MIFQASLNCSYPSPHFAATLFANFSLSSFLRNHLYKARAVHSFGSPPCGYPLHNSVPLPHIPQHLVDWSSSRS